MLSTPIRLPHVVLLFLKDVLGEARLVEQAFKIGASALSMQTYWTIWMLWTRMLGVPIQPSTSPKIRTMSDAETVRGFCRS